MTEKCSECRGKGRIATNAGDSDECAACRGEGSRLAQLLVAAFNMGWRHAQSQRTSPRGLTSRQVDQWLGALEDEDPIR